MHSQMVLDIEGNQPKLKLDLVLRSWRGVQEIGAGAAEATRAGAASDTAGNGAASSTTGAGVPYTAENKYNRRWRAATNAKTATDTGSPATGGHRRGRSRKHGRGNRQETKNTTR